MIWLLQNDSLGLKNYNEKNVWKTHYNLNYKNSLIKIYFFNWKIAKSAAIQLGFVIENFRYIIALFLSFRVKLDVSI